MPTGIEESIVAATVAGTSEASGVAVGATTVANEATVAVSAETAVKEGTEILKDALERLSTEKISQLHEKILRASDEQIRRSRELITNDSQLRLRQAEILDRYSNSSGHIDEVLERFRSNEKHFKGRFGEEYDKQLALEQGADVERAGKAESTFGDLHVKYSHPVKSECITLKGGRIVKEPFTLKPNVPYAREIKNGQKDYLMQQIQTHHLQRQLLDQKALGFEPLTIVNEDFYSFAEQSPEDAAKFIKANEDIGSKVIPVPPTHDVQILSILGGLL